MNLRTSATLAALLSICLSGAAVAANDPAAAPAAPATDVAPLKVAPPKPEDKVICKYVEETGSRLGGKRVCMKRSDWQAQSQQAQDQRNFAPPAGIGGSH
jgi:hypothetical protein